MRLSAESAPNEIQSLMLEALRQRLGYEVSLADMLAMARPIIDKLPPGYLDRYRRWREKRSLDPTPEQRERFGAWCLLLAQRSDMPTLMMVP